MKPRYGQRPHSDCLTPSDTEKLHAQLALHCVYTCLGPGRGPGGKEREDSEGNPSSKMGPLLAS